MLTRAQIADYARTLIAQGFPITPVPAGTGIIPLYVAAPHASPAINTDPSRIAISGMTCRPGCAMWRGLVYTPSGGQFMLVHIMPGGWEIFKENLQRQTQAYRVAHAAILAAAGNPTAGVPISEQVSLIKQMLTDGKFRGMEKSIAEFASILLREPIESFGNWEQGDRYFRSPTDHGINAFVGAAIQATPGLDGEMNPLGHNLPMCTLAILQPMHVDREDCSDGMYRGLRIELGSRIVRGQGYYEFRLSRSNLLDLRYPTLFSPVADSYIAEIAAQHNVTCNPTTAGVSMHIGSGDNATQIAVEKLFTLPDDAP